MRMIIQWAEQLSITADGADRGSIPKGLFVLLGISKNDTPAIAEKMAQKLLTLRMISDENGKMNLSCLDPKAESELAVVSNFTLYANCKSRRPDFLQSAGFEQAGELYELFLGYLKLGAKELVQKEGGRLPRLITGVFGAHMEIRFSAVGPHTVLLDSDEPGLLK